MGVSVVREFWRDAPRIQAGFAHMRERQEAPRPYLGYVLTVIARKVGVEGEDGRTRPPTQCMLKSSTAESRTEDVFGFQEDVNYMRRERL